MSDKGKRAIDVLLWFVVVIVAVSVLAFFVILVLGDTDANAQDTDRTPESIEYQEYDGTGGAVAPPPSTVVSWGSAQASWLYNFADAGADYWFDEAYGDGAANYPSSQTAMAAGWRCHARGHQRTGWGKWHVYKLWRVNMRVEFCFNGRSVKKPTVAVAVWGGIIDRGGFLGWHKVQGPIRVALHCNNYNGISRHNCLGKYTFHFQRKSPIRPPWWDGVLKDVWYGISMRWFGDGHVNKGR